jgi:integrase
MWYTVHLLEVTTVRAKPSLLARVKHDGKFPRVGVQISRNAIKLPVKALGRTFSIEDVIGFYARFSANGRRPIKALGKDPVSAYTQFQQIELDNTRVRKGLLPLNPEPESSPQPEPGGKRSLRTCVNEFKANLPTLGKKKSTIASYTRTLDDFVAQFPTKTVDQITKQDMIDHLAHLRTTVKRRKYGDPQRTFRNRLSYLCIFFNTLGLKCPLPLREMKKPMKSRPTKYSLEIINKMLAVANENEKDLIHFFLNTGFRDEEVAYAKWSDIDFEQGSINVHPKPEYNWSPKDSEFREQDIVLHPKFIKRMKARREHGHASALIFPTEKGTPNMHLIKIVQRVAKRAGITDKRITLHAFRRTFGTIVAKEYGLEQARIWLGHSDIQTTQAYIACDELTTEQSRKKVKAMFAGVGD